MFRKKELSERIFAYGDVDTRGASGDDRLAILNAEEGIALAQAKSSGELAIREAFVRWRDIDLVYQRIRDRRLARNRNTANERLVASEWLRLGAAEKYPHVNLSIVANLIIVILLAGLDFYVFANAYALVDDVVDFSVGWWVGGLLGLVVFISGVIFAHQSKRVVVTAAQKALVEELRLDDSTYSPRIVIRDQERVLPQISANWISLFLSGALFFSLVILALLVRFEDDHGSAVTSIMMGLVPVVIVSIELYFHDPLFRKEENAGWRERHLERKVNRLRDKLDTVVSSYRGYVDRIQSFYSSERRKALVDARDRGMDISESALEPDRRSSQQWMIDVATLLKDQTGAIVPISNQSPLGLGTAFEVGDPDAS